MVMTTLSVVYGTIGTKSIPMTVKLCPSIEYWKCASMAELIILILYFFPDSKTVSNFLPPPIQLGSAEFVQSNVLVPLISPVSSVGLIS